MALWEVVLEAKADKKAIVLFSGDSINQAIDAYNNYADYYPTDTISLYDEDKALIFRKYPQISEVIDNRRCTR